MTDAAARSAPSADPSASAAVDWSEIAKFDALAARWWDPDGPMGPLHRMQPARLDFLIEQIAAQFGRDPSRPRPFEGLSLLDVGCGGGLAAEPFARLGARVVGIDAAAEAIAAARAHAAAQALEIAYRVETAEALAAAGETFDVVISLEVIEHAPEPRSFTATLARLARPGGLVALSTLNRTARAYALAIVGAERVLGWLPRGTHDWRKFLTPDELAAALDAAGLTPAARAGFVFAPLTRSWRVDPRDLSVNYAIAATRP